MTYTWPLLLEISGGRCEWRGCEAWGTEAAHVHSKGMGGTPDGRRDRIQNVMLACEIHARVTDGQPPPGPDGMEVYRREILELLGGVPATRVAWQVAETLRAHLVESRRAFQLE